MEYDTLVLSGNSTNAVFTLGALQRLFDEHILDKDKLNVYFGTSSGSFVSLLLALNFDPIDILSCLCVDKSYSKVVSTFNLANLGCGGILNFDPIEKEVENWLISRLGYIPTMSEIKDRYGKDLYFVTFNMTDGKKEYISRDTYPNLGVVKAARMSSTFPFIFSPFEFDGKFYVDGGISDNFAMNKAQLLGGTCMGLCSVNTIKPYTPTMTIFELFFQLFSVFVCSSADNIITLPGNDIIKLQCDNCFFNFSSSNSELIKFFDIGYDKCRGRPQKSTLDL